MEKLEMGEEIAWKLEMHSPLPPPRSPLILGKNSMLEGRHLSAGAGKAGGANFGDRDSR